MMKTVVVRNIPRGSAAVIAELREAGVATVHEAMGRCGLMSPVMRPIYAGASIAGPAVTALVAPGDNWMLHVAAEQCRAGDVLVVACMVENTDGMIGDLIATSLQARGAMGFPVWSRAISARGTVKATLGNVNLPVVCAGTLVNGGDVVIADDDGVVVVPHAEIEAVAKLARQRMDKEEASRKRYAAGELVLDVANMRGALEKNGLRYVNSIDEV
jgi:4-hydroxy-4-methyl-2-oxoglutarate aldolase